ncbi:hypothetical protein [Leptospira interrogans]|uniref:hypothetical protein n=2 Tax=Leptospira interrogans TaxID=173 RepID=UPI0002CBD931|nr:hypothetical protein [Leptospira interrogans]ENO73561.1 hypothetical protein LEP1GSC012_1708 [Leptospira interrogans serovar Valbuzzi str. Valbuzzi]
MSEPERSEETKLGAVPIIFITLEFLPDTKICLQYSTIMKYKIPEALLIILLTAITYIAAYIHKFGKYYHYKIDTVLIQIDYKDLIFPFIYLLLLVFTISIIQLLFRVLIYSDAGFMKKIASLNEYQSLFIFLLNILIIFTYFVLYKSMYLLIASYLISLLQISKHSYEIQLDLQEYNTLSNMRASLEEDHYKTQIRINSLRENIKSINSKPKLKTIEKINSSIDEIEKSNSSSIKTTETLKDQMNKEINVNKSFLLFNAILALGIVLLIFFNFGRSEEEERINFLSYDKYLIIDKVNNSYILKEYNPENKTINKDFSIINVPENKILNLKILSIGPLKVSE